MQLSASKYSSQLHLARAQLIGHLPQAGSRSQIVAAEFSGKHRPAGKADGRQVAGSGSHQQGWRGLVAAHQQNDSVNRIAADRLFHVHAGQVAEQHGGRAQLRFAQRHHGKFQRKAACLPHAALHKFGKLAKMRVAGRQLRPGIADPDHRPAIEQVVRPALILHPASVEETIAILSSIPFLAAQLLHYCVLLRELATSTAGVAIASPMIAQNAVLQRNALAASNERQVFAGKKEKGESLKALPLQINNLLVYSRAGSPLTLESHTPPASW